MGTRTPEIDAYIAKAPEFARPILERIRAAFHAGCPAIEERIKWGVPSFEYRGMLGGMAAFKHHVTFGFWKSRLMEDFDRLFARGPRSSPMGVRVTSLADLPAKKVLVAYVKEARRLNDEGVKEPRRASPKRAVRVVVPPDLTAALAKDAKARATFEGFSPSHRREYIEWITEAKRDETRRRRLETTLAWLAEGRHRNWKYERKA
ncbi:MAG TPA: YdeI/OmpD-associated family protein [Candidatus Polarisedimenticolaceae bacterium]